MAINKYEDMMMKEQETSVSPAAPAAPAVDKYEQIAQQQNQMQTTSIAQSMNYAIEKEPSRIAKALKMADELGLDVGTVDRNMEKLEKKSKLAAVDYEAMMRDTPGVAKFMETPENAALGRDDMGAMGKIDKAARFIPKRDMPNPFVEAATSAFDFGKDMQQAGDSGWNSLTSNLLGLRMVFEGPSREYIERQAFANKRSQQLSEARPEYSKEFNAAMEEEGGDVTKAWKKVTGAYGDWMQGNTLQALKGFIEGDVTLVAETLDLLRHVAQRPKGLAYSVSENAVNSLPAMGLGYLGLHTGPAAFVTAPMGAAVGSAITEIGATMNGLLQEKGIDTTDPDQLEAAYSNPQIMSDIRSQALKKGITLGVIDGLSAAFGGKLIRSAGQGASRAEKVIAGAKGVGFEMATESFGEAASQGVQKGDIREIDLGSALQEGITSLGQSAVTASQSAAVRGEFAVRDMLDKSPIKAAHEVVGQADQAIKAMQGLDSLQQLGAAIKETKNLKEVPGKIGELVEAATGGKDASAVYFQTDEFDNYWKSKGESPAQKAGEIMGDGGKAYEQAKNTTGLVEIPLEQYASTVGVTEDFEGMLPITRTSADGMTLSEARETMVQLPSVMKQLALEATNTQEARQSTDEQRQQTVEQRVESRQIVMQQELGRALTEEEIAGIKQQVSTEVVQEKTDMIGSGIQEQLVAAGRPVREAKFAAQLVQSSFGNVAQRMGFSPEQFDQFISDYLPTIQKADAPAAQAAGKQVLNQSSLDKLKQNAEKLKSEGFDIWVSENLTFDENGEETVGPNVGEPGYSFSVQAQDATGNDIGQARFIIDSNGELIPDDADGATEAVNVDASFRRKGIATELYRQAAEHVGKPILNLGGQTELGKKLRQSLREIDETIFYQKSPTKKQIKELNSIITKEIEDKVGKEIGLKVDTSGMYSRNHEDYIGDMDSDTQIDQDVPVRMPKDKRIRAADAGFDVSHSWFHGTKANIIEFSENTLGSSTGAGSARMAHFFASSPQTASDYALASDDARSLRTLREYRKAQAAVKDFESEMIDKYGDRWLKRMNGEDTAAFNELDAEVIRAEEEYSENLVSNNDTNMLDYEIKRQEENILYLQDKIKNGKNIEENLESQKYADLLKVLVDDTTFVKAEDGAGFNIIDKNGNKIPNPMNKGRDDILFRFWDNEQAIKNRIEKIEFRILNNSTEALMQSLEESIKVLNQKKDERSKILEGVDQEVVYQTVLRMDAPLIVDFNGAEYREVTYREILEVAQNYGFDGVIFKNTYDPAFIGPARRDILMDVAAVFSPNQIRSVNAEFKNIDSANILNQGDDSPIGQIRFGETGINIDLLEGANPSTFLHEMGHAYMTILRDLSKREDATQQIKDDLKTVLDWLGAETSELTVEQEEKFARGFEAYLREGKAPSSALQKAFVNFKTWLMVVYQSIKNLKVELTPAVNDVFDRLIATDEQIAEARGYISSEFNLNAVEAPTEEQARYLEKVAEWKNEAEEQLARKLMADYDKKSSKEYKALEEMTRATVENEANQMKIYNLMAYLESGLNADGSKIDENTPRFKIDKQAIRDNFPKGTLNTLRKYTAEQGGDFAVVDPSVIASMYGYNSSRDLISALTNTPTKDSYVESVTEQRMQETFPDLMNDDGMLFSEAMKIVHEDKGAQVKRMELEMIAKKALPDLKEGIRQVARRMPSNKQIKAEAMRIIRESNQSTVKPVVYLRAERKFAKQAGVLLARGDFAGAFESKRKELYNYELYKAAVTFNDQKIKTLKFFKKINKSKDEDTAKTRDNNIVRATKALIARYLGDDKARHPMDHLQQIKKYDEDAYNAMENLIESVIIPKESFDDMTVEEFMNVADVVKSLWDFSKTSKEIMVDGKAVAIDKAVDEIVESVRFMQKEGKLEGYDRTANETEKTKMDLLGLVAAFTRFETVADIMGETYRKYLFTGPSRAEDQRAALSKKYKEKIVALSKPIAQGMDLKKSIRSDELNFEFKNLSEVLGALYHTGNESNMQKLIVGRNWGVQDEQTGIVDTSKFDSFINRLIDDGTLTKEHFDYIQALWDINEEIKPMAQKAFKRIFGYYFDEITSKPFTNKFGTYRGGYAPAKVDPHAVNDIFLRQELENFINSNPTYEWPASGGRGFTMKRVDSFNKPLNLDLGLAVRHVDDAIRFAVVKPAVVDAAKLLMNQRFREEMGAINPSFVNELDKVVKPALNRADKGMMKVDDPSTPPILIRGFRILQKNAAMQLMVGNVVNTLEQFVGPIVALTKVEAKYMFKAVMRYSLNPKQIIKQVEELSPYMKNRNDTHLFEMDKQSKRIFEEQGKYDKTQEWLETHGYFLQAFTQKIVDNAVWMAAYEQSIAKGVTPSIAVDQADSVVRQTQGANRAMDVSSIESNQWLQFVQMFFKFFNMLTNLNIANFKKLYYEDMGMTKKYARGMYLYATGFASIAIISGALRKLAAGGLDADDDDEYLDDLYDVFIGSQLDLGLAMIPIGGSAIKAGLNQINDKQYDDRVSASPAITAISTVVGTVSKAATGQLFDDKKQKQDVRDALTALGVVTGMPTGALNRPVSYEMDRQSGRARPKGPVDAARGYVTGKPGVRD